MSSQSKTLHILHGPNLNLIGIRETDIYGDISWEGVLQELRDEFPSWHIEYFQSNHEGDLIDYLQAIGYEENYILFNPAGYTHSSIALGDTVAAIEAPVIEIHISDTTQREPYRRISYIRPHVVHVILGRGVAGYAEAIQWIEDQ